MNSSQWQLSAEETNLTISLSNKIKQQIKLTGSISFAEYMQLALYDAEYGYYINQRNKLGGAGDFITAPNISGLFGLCLARQIQQLWQYGVAPTILEFGAGNGQLMIDLLHELGDKLDYYLVIEVSPSLRYLQLEKIRQQCPQYLAKVQWLDQAPSAFHGLILANEVLDAMPCERVRFTENGIFQLQVALDKDEQLIYQDKLASGELLQIAQQLTIPQLPYLTEISLTNRGFVRYLADTLAQGVILLIDYGQAQQEYYHEQRNQGSVRGFFRQQLVDDVLTLPGLIDITCNVDFGAVYAEATSSGLNLLGYTRQAPFLINCGLTELLSSIKVSASEASYLNFTNQVNRLISPNFMGEVFKVIGLSRGLSKVSCCGFSQHDNSYLITRDH